MVTVFGMGKVPILVTPLRMVTVLGIGIIHGSGTIISLVTMLGMVTISSDKPQPQLAEYHYPHFWPSAHLAIRPSAHPE